MASNSRFNIKPMHIILAGLAIITLGVLVPSFFINPYSTIGLSFIVGCIILLSGYAFFAVNLVKLKGEKTIKWLALPVIISLIVAGGFYGYDKYKQYNSDRIYTTNEVIRFDDLIFSVSKAEFQNVNLTLDNEFVTKHGLDTQENCNDLSRSNTWTTDILRGGEEIWGRQSGVSDYEVCTERNKSRTAISKYLSNNKRLVVTYKISAIRTVATKDFNIALMPDSGRNVAASMDWLNNEARWTHKIKTDTHRGVTRTVYDSWTIFPIYKAFSKTDLGSDVNKGLDRTGNVSTDIRSDERNIDIKITYKDETRIMRINR